MACPTGVDAQAPAASEANAITIEGPPPPTAPDVINRDDEGRATLRAVRTAEPLRIDGELDEAFYRNTAPVSDFVQSLPNEGAAPTERTEAWVGFDGSNVYVSADFTLSDESVGYGTGGGGVAGRLASQPAHGHRRSVDNFIRGTRWTWDVEDAS